MKKGVIKSLPSFSFCFFILLSQKSTTMQPKSHIFESENNVYYISNTRCDIPMSQGNFSKSGHVNTPRSKKQQKARKAAKTARKARKRNR